MAVREVHRIGSVHQVLPPEELMPMLVEIAEMIEANAPLAAQGTKAVAQFWRRYGLEKSKVFTEKVGNEVLGSKVAGEDSRRSLKRGQRCCRTAGL